MVLNSINWCVHKGVNRDKGSGREEGEFQVNSKVDMSAVVGHNSHRTGWENEKGK